MSLIILFIHIRFLNLSEFRIFAFQKSLTTTNYVLDQLSQWQNASFILALLSGTPPVSIYAHNERTICVRGERFWSKRTEHTILRLPFSSIRITKIYLHYSKPASFISLTRNRKKIQHWCLKKNDRTHCKLY